MTVRVYQQNEGKNFIIMSKYFKPHWLLIFVPVLFLFILGGVTVSIFSDLNSLITELLLVKVSRPSGMFLPRQLDGHLRPVAVIIDNHLDSRPAAGLEKASIVYEVPVEGGLTRYLAIFDAAELPEKIGPIRSARPYFIDFAGEWQAILLHCGGSPDALARLKSGTVDYLNEFSADGIYFWRDSQRVAPYNLFTSEKLIKKAIVNKKFEESGNFLPWQFKKEKELKARPIDVPDIQVPFNEPGYEVRYRYNRAGNFYERYLGLKPHQTASGKLLTAKNVAVQYVDHRVLDKLGRLRIQTEGLGKVEIYQDGEKILGYWENESGRTRFFSDDGIEVRFNPGTIWVEVVFE